MKRSKLFSIIFVIATLSLSILYLVFAWNRYQGIASSEAVQLAESLEALLHPEHIAELSGGPEDLEKPEYSITKAGMMRLEKATNPIRFAYLVTERNDEIVILMDSESPDSPDYSPPGQVYEEADDILWAPFRSGSTVLTKPITDRWGTWISALVPIKSADGETIAVLGIDYDAAEWQADVLRQMLPDAIIVLTLLLLFAALRRSRELQKKIALDEALYHCAFDQAPIGVAIVHDKSFASESDFGNMTGNPMFERTLGRTVHDLAAIKWPDITHPDDLAADLEKFEQFKKGEIDGYSMEKRFLRPDGSSIWTNMRISPLVGYNNDRSMHLCLIEDISERKQAEIALKEKERRENVIMTHLPGMAYRCSYDVDWTMQYVSDGCYSLTGYTPDSLLNNKDLSYNDLITPEFRELLWNEWACAIAEKNPFKYEYEITTASGERKWVLEMGQGIFSEQGEVEALEGIILDISDRKQVENSLKYINEHDSWTGLYNREYLEKTLERDAVEMRMRKRAIISINLSTVQLLTANYGFNYTQNLIKNAAEALRLYCTDKRTLFKTYENRFVFYIIDYKDKNELVCFSEALAATLESLFVTDRIGGGIGILEIGQDDNDVDIDLLLRRLLIASERSINIFERDFRACFYDEELEALVNRERDIRQALSAIAADNSDDELLLHYQPILDLRTDSICGFEALARLKTVGLGLVSPVEFVPIAERTKLIIPIGEKVILRAFDFLNKLKEHGFGTMSVSINISAIQLLRPDFTERLFEMISEMRVDPENIGLEITESVFTSDYEDINGIIGKLKDAGLHIAIDDFGTGYSSLAREKELSVSCLKIDKYFMDKLMDLDIEKAITGDIISMAHRLGHCAVAEGVEYREQLWYLREHGCDKAQGYLISKPLEQDAALEFLKSRMNNDCKWQPE